MNRAVREVCTSGGAAWVRRATRERPRKHRRRFLLLTLPILVSDLLFVGINQYASQRTLRLSLQRSGDNHKLPMT